MNQRGFTVIELLALSVILILVGVTFWIQKNNLETAARDDKRKISVNALYYGLEEVYYPTNKYYPKSLSPTTLPSVDSKLFKDPNGVQIGKSEADLRYEGKNCSGEACKSYELRAELENEADVVKTSRNK
ncbi:MAG TPA: type II secretion system protein [Candidatus Saccharibacteria bacterium]|nr:type II secretion system protein [Candidatus Saccharibacteria bacterium]HRK93889.1 type II secretion system protein [Candidatus Saccharibacteria bacterium]